MTRQPRLASPPGTAEDGRAKGKEKQSMFVDICHHLNIPLEKGWLSAGSTVTAEGLEAVLTSVAKETGVPPEHLPDHEKVVWRLLHKSIEAMILALEVINKPSISYRLECSLFLLLNAWELLLKAKIVQDETDVKAIYRKEDPEKTRFFLDLLKTVFTSARDGIRMNLEDLYERRNEAAHLFISFVPSQALMLFQAAILNYDKCAKDWFDRSLRERLPYGMIFLVADIGALHSANSPALNKKLSSETLVYLKKWRDKFWADIQSLPDDEKASYAVTVNINLSVITNPKKADATARIDKGVGASSIPLIKDRDKLERCRLSFTELLEKIKEKRPDVKQPHVHNIIKKYHVKEDPTLSDISYRTYKDKIHHERTGELKSTAAYIYNYAAVQFILDKLNDGER